MGFPLSTDIFGQLAWLVKQVKLLVFRVTKIEQGGGAGAQNINQVLATGNSAANKFLQFNIDSNTSALKIGNDTINGLSINLTEDPTVGYVSSTNITIEGFSQSHNGGELKSDLTPGSLALYDDSTGNTITYLSSGMYIGPVANKDGLILNDDQYTLGQSDSSNINGGLDLNFGTGHYRLGDWNGVSLPDSYTVYLDISSSKADSSIKSYYLGFNNGLYIDHSLGVYGFKNEQNNNCYFGMGFNSSNQPALKMTNDFIQGGLFTTAVGNLRVIISGTPYYIELWQ